MIVWEDKYSVGVAQFDEAHKRLVAMINELYEAMRQGRGQQVIAKTFVGLIEYARTHFREEEAAMEGCDYPDAGQHAHAHRELLDQVLALQVRFHQGEALIAVQVLDFLRGWLMNHIAGTDKQYGPYLNSKGIH